MSRWIHFRHIMERGKKRKLHRNIFGMTPTNMLFRDTNMHGQTVMKRER